MYNIQILENPESDCAHIETIDNKPYLVCKNINEINEIIGKSILADAYFLIFDKDIDVDSELGKAANNITDIIYGHDPFRAIAIEYKILWKNKFKNLEKVSNKSVYVMRFDNNTTKVGISYNPKERANQISCAEHSKVIKIWHSKPIAKAPDIERKCHEQLSEYRLYGEFFDVSFDEAIKTVKKVMHENL